MQLNKKEMCTLEKLGSVYLLTLTGDDEHRINPVILDSIRGALAFVRKDSARAGSSTALVTTSVGKFFCNGLDVDWTSSSPVDRVPMIYTALEKTVADYISLPMPTIAAVTGHATGVGFGLVLCHDYVLMRSDRGFLYMSELDIGMPLPPIHLFTALVRSKIANTRSLRDVALRPGRITAGKAVAMGIVDQAVGGAKETVEASLKLGEELAGRKWDGRVYASVRKMVFAEVGKTLGSDVQESNIATVPSRL